MIRRLLVLALAATCTGGFGFAQTLAETLLACHAVASAGERLACYDALARAAAPPRFVGHHNAVTELFTLDRPHRLRFRSDGVIFVLYLMDAKGEVIQNLHIGGAGEDEYLIEKPGVYQLRINGAEGWRIWLDPE
ncbi:hypothetical protein SAMN06265338_11442 [Rhodoblastus acidophilus]|uniref:T9SS type A sorting domain-containing protein n=1 Tax=Rhodoblastus acidophilus TaxID=1074 RepID=A0A212S6W6_RHOAC|nr:hypothetical protein [Rhodoblastus acidophilus]SNB81008.1 hypothetical protein SAMN06265338_11442 [Rhodoblastus acidophilus]